MKSVTRYECQFCGSTFKSDTNCLKHELEKHIGLTMQGFRKWIDLKEQNEYMRIMASKVGNDHLIPLADKTLRDLEAFIEKHDLTKIDIDFDLKEFVIYDGFKDKKIKKIKVSKGLM